MKTRIKITESQYKEIFLNENKGVITEDAVTTISGILKKLSRTILNEPLSVSPQNITKIRKAFKIADNVTLNTVDDILKSALRTTDKLSATQIKTLFSIDSLVNDLIKMLETDQTIIKLLKLRQTAVNISVDHPSIKKIDDILGKYIPIDYLDDVIERSDVGGISKELMKTAAGKYTSEEMKKIFNQIKNHQDLISWMEKNNENLLSLTKTSNSVNLLSPKSRELWYKISKDLKKYLPLLEKTNDDLLEILSNENIDANLFKKKLLSANPGKTKQFFLYLYNNTLLGDNYFGKKLIGGFLILSSMTILGYSGKKLIDFVNFINSGGGKEEESTTKQKIENSLEGLISYIKSTLSKEQVENFNNLLKNNEIEITSDVDDDTKWSLTDFEGKLTGEKQIIDFEWNGTTFE